MKKILVAILTVICLTVVSAQESRSPKPEKQNPTVGKTQPNDKIQETRIVDLSSLLQNRFQLTEDLTGKALKDEKGLCAVHHHVLKEARVPIIYGLIPGVFYPAETVKKSFPNAITQIKGGCMVMSVKEAKVLQCEKCLASKTQWTRRNTKGASPKL